MDSSSSALIPGSSLGDPQKGSYGSIETIQTYQAGSSDSDTSLDHPYQNDNNGSPPRTTSTTNTASTGDHTPTNVQHNHAAALAIPPGSYTSPAATAGGHLHAGSRQGQEAVLTSPLKAIVEMTHIPVADERGHLAHYPGEEQDHLEREKYLNEKQERKEAFLALLGSGFAGFKCLYSFCLWLFSVVVVMAAISSKQTVATEAGVPIPLAYCIFWFLIGWLAKMEGGQACLVGLQPVDKALYAHTHPRTLMSTSLAHKGDNMERFIVGRQFLVCLVVFLCEMTTASIKDASVLGLSDGWTASFLGSGVAVTLIAIMVGQSAQVNAANCMLDFINTYFMWVTTVLSLILDMSGVLHSVYLVQMVFSKLTHTPIESDEPPRSGMQNVFFFARAVFSCVALGYCFAVTLSGLFHGQTTAYEGVPQGISVLILSVLLCFVGIMEGMQIALFAVVNLPPDEVDKHPIAAKCCTLTFQDSNLQSFLIGRQMCVTLSMFIIARITRCDVLVGEDTVFGVSDSIQMFFNTGLLGAFITTIVGSLAWRIIASSFPVAFLSNPIVYAIIRLCLVVEGSGICSVAWVLALGMKQIFRYQLDEVYIGTLEERTEAAAAAAKEDDTDLEKRRLFESRSSTGDNNAYE